MKTISNALGRCRLLTVLAALLVAFLVISPVITSLYSYVLGNTALSGDVFGTSLWYWMVSNSPLRGENPFVNDYQLYPVGMILLRQYGMFLDVLPFSPLYALLPFPASYNLSVLLAVFLNILAGSVLFSRISGDRLAGLAISVVVCLQPVILLEIVAGRFTYALLFWLLLTLDRALLIARDDHGWKPWIYLSLLFIATSATYYFYGILCFLFLLGLGTAHLTRKKISNSPVSLTLIKILAAAIFCGGVLLCFSWAWLIEILDTGTLYGQPALIPDSAEISLYDPQDPRHAGRRMGPHPLAAPNADHAPKDPSMHPLYSRETNEVPILITLLLFSLLLSVLRGFRPPGYILAAIFFFLLSLGPVLSYNNQIVQSPYWQSLTLPYQLFRNFFPFLSRLHCPYRASVLVVIMLGILMSHNAKWFLKKTKSTPARTFVMGASLLLISFFELWFRGFFPLPISSFDVPSVYHKIAKDDGVALIEYPFGNVPYKQVFLPFHQKRMLGLEGTSVDFFMHQYSSKGYQEFFFNNQFLSDLYYLQNQFLEGGQRVPSSLSSTGLGQLHRLGFRHLVYTEKEIAPTSARHQFPLKDIWFRETKEKLITTLGAPLYQQGHLSVFSIPPPGR